VRVRMVIVDRDVVGQWFEAIASLGEDTHIHFGRVGAKGATPEWFDLPHARFDGIGGFAELLRTNGHSGLGALPELKRGRTHRVLDLIRSWLRYVFRLRPTYVFLPMSDRSKTGAKAVTRVFDVEETELIADRAKALGVTVNTLLLDRITRVVRRRLDGAPRDVAWMIPVNMRGPVTLDRDTGNHSSFLEIRVRDGEPETMLQERVLGAIAQGDHWAFWYVFKVGRLFGRIGRKLFMRMTINGRPHWVGSFSNLGRWDPPADGATPWAWVFFPPPVPSQPLGVGCVTYHGRLGVALQLHSSLGTDASAEAWMADVVRELVN
jgi:hypothetical protein